MSGWYPDYPPSRPRRVEGGLQARSRRGQIGESWWSRRFIALLESFRLGARLDRGRRYARAGQVLDLAVTAGAVRARVQGSRARPYKVMIEAPPLPEKAWQRAEEAIASRAVFVARLLAGEMPRDIEEAFTAAGVSLFPTSTRELASACSCPDHSNPCKHIAAVYYLLAEAFDDDPFLILAWRGRAKDTLLARVRALRAAEPDAAATAVALGKSSAAGDRTALVPAVETPPLADCLDHFWSQGDLATLRIRPQAAELPDALPRQLDPPTVDVWGRGFGGARVGLNELLSPAYQTLTSAAERVALGEDA